MGELCNNLNSFIGDSIYARRNSEEKASGTYSMYDANSYRVIELADFHLLPDRFPKVCNWKPSKAEYDAQLLQQLFYSQDSDSQETPLLGRI